jgi:hypothetical protein
MQLTGLLLSLGSRMRGTTLFGLGGGFGNFPTFFAAAELGTGCFSRGKDFIQASTQLVALLILGLNDACNCFCVGGHFFQESRSFGSEQPPVILFFDVPLKNQET